MTRLGPIAGALALTLALTATAEAQAQTPTQTQAPAQTSPPPPVMGPPAQPQPAQPAYQGAYRPVESGSTTITGLWVPGIIIFAATYAIDLFVAAIGTDTGGGTYTDWLYAPVIGPWGALANADDGIERFFGVLTGLLQAAGLTMFVLGLTLRRPTEPYYALDPDDPHSARLSVDLAPLPGGGMLGVTLSHF